MPVDKKSMNKRGQTTIFLVFLILISLFAVIFLFVMGYVVIKINTFLNEDVMVGQVSLPEVTSQTWGIYTTMFLKNADFWGLCVIFGMTFGLFLSSYFLRDTFPKYGIIFDIFIIFASFIVSIYVSNAYGYLLDALNSAGENFLEVYAIKTSLFVKNLPIFSVIIGVIMMFLFHASIPKKKEERYLEGGFIQGEY